MVDTSSGYYTFNYGEFGLIEDVWAGEYCLAAYEYTDDGNYYLKSLDYGNGWAVQYEYDNRGRLIQEEFGVGTNTYTYDNNGDLAIMTDSATGITTKYYYDLIGRLVKQEEKGGNRSHTVQYTYNNVNNLASLQETINGVPHSNEFAYDNINRVTSVTNDDVSEHYDYDDFGRMNQSVTKDDGTVVLTESYTFTAPSANATSGQIATGRLQAAGYDVTYTYTYDGNGNILSISDGTYTTSYEYDSANQLIRENNQEGGFTYIWEYDDAGNILCRGEYDYTTGKNVMEYIQDEVFYIYEEEYCWGDLLIGYNDESVYLDAIGNVEGDGTWEYIWQNGRELEYMFDGDNEWYFVYDGNGMRTKRSNYEDLTYQYIYNGSSLSQMTVGNNTLYFAYGANGVPMSVTYNNVTYYYVVNIQGDIIAILNAAGTPVVRYSYDAWGNPISTTGTMASTLGVLNPLRYRGYVYDQETGLYYLQSRYYNPEWGRFINADAFVSTGQGLLGNNMFAYCNNSPIMLVDYRGNIPKDARVSLFAMSLDGGGGYSPYISKEDKAKFAAIKKYNNNTINLLVDGIGTDPDKLNVTFYPNEGLIHIENSYDIKDKQEKLAIIDVIMSSEYYDASIYGNCVDTMLIEWSGHNFVYHTASASSVIYKLYQRLGYETPIQSTQGVDFRRSLAPSARRNYRLVTLGGKLQW